MLGKDDRVPTLVMGASIVMEWIRAIEECLLCELPGRRDKKNLNLQSNNKLRCTYDLYKCVQSTLIANRSLGRFYKLTGNAQSFHHLSPFALTITPPRRCGSYVERAFPPVFVLTRLDV